MDYKVILTSPFHARLEEAFAYRLENYGTRSARRRSDKLHKAIATVKTMPHYGRTLDDRQKQGDCFRWMKVDSYSAIYQVDYASRTIKYHNLFSGSSNWRGKVLS